MNDNNYIMYYECLNCGIVAEDDFWIGEENICENCGSDELYFFDNNA